MERPDAQTSNPSLSVRLFGPFDVRVQGVPLPPLRTRKGQWLLALLVLRPEKQVSRAWLAETLWPQSGEEEALRNLRQSLYDLRRALGQQAHRLHSATQNTLGLEMNGAFVDVVAFDAAIQKGDNSSLEQAVHFYQGPFLEGCTAGWALQERQIREQAYLQALAQAAMEQGDTGAAMCHLHAVIAADPLRESAQRSLIQALADEGDFAAAAQVYRDLRLLLHRDLHADPDPQTVALFERLRRQSRTLVGSPSSLVKTTSAGSLIFPDASSKEGPPSVHALPNALRTPIANPNNLPAQLTSFIGRESERQTVWQILTGCRLLTLTGVGGCGKTRLALQVATEILADYPDGVWLVDLTSLFDPSLVAASVLQSLGAQEETGRTALETLLDHLRSKKPLLLILDNCEHLVAVCAALIETILRHAPQVKVLATSRETLKVAGEQPWRVPPLEYPAGDLGIWEEKDTTALLEYDACRLFVERARVQRPELTLDRGTMQTLVKLCARLDGMPLAIELAAARALSLSVEEILSRLDDRFRLLRNVHRNAPPRQRTLKAVLDWSYDLLNESERLLLGRLSLFAGGWSLEAAEQVCSGEGIEAWEVLDVLSELIDKSLVIAEQVNGHIRYRLLETVRQYSQDRLNELDEYEVFRNRHRDYFVSLAEAAAAARGFQSLDWWRSEADNLYAALQRWLDVPQEPEIGLRLVAAMGHFWELEGPLNEGRVHLTNMLARKEAQKPTPARAKALGVAASLASNQGDNPQAHALYQQSLAIFQELDDQAGIATSLRGLATIANVLGDRAGAWEHYERCLSLWQAMADKPSIAGILWEMGYMAGEQKDYLRARTLYEQSLAIFEQLDDKKGIINSLIGLGGVASERGDYAGARAYIAQALALEQALGLPGRGALNLYNLATLSYEQGDYEQARLLGEKVFPLVRESGRPHLEPTLLEFLGQVHHKLGKFAQAYLNYEKALKIYRERGKRREEALLLERLGTLAVDQGQWEQARSWLRQSLVNRAEMKELPAIIRSLEAFARLELAQRKADRAARLLGSAATLREKTATPVSPGERAEYDERIRVIRSVLGEEAFAAAWAEGGAMMVEQAIEYAFADQQ